MQLHIIAVGRKVPDWVDHGYQEYARRFPANLAVNLSCIATPRRGSGASVEGLRLQEAEAMRKKIIPGGLTIALDEMGKEWTTRQWAEELTEWMQLYPRVTFVIGGPDGLAPQLTRETDIILALGRLTLPHGLARVVLIEQLYRAWTLITGHPYHRA